MSARLFAVARQALAVVVTIYLAFGPGFVAPAAAQAQSSEPGHGSISGTLYQADEKTALAGAMVAAIDARTGKQYRSEVTMKNGNYLVDGVPAGTYDLVVVVGGNLFVVDDTIHLLPNESLAHSFAVRPERPASRSIDRMQKPKGSATPVGSSRGTGAAAGEPTGDGRAFWRSPGGIVLVSALTVGAMLAIINNNGDTNASPSAP